MSGTEMMGAAAAGLRAAGSLMQGITAYQSARMQAAIARREGDAAMRAAEVEQDQMLTEGDRALGEARAVAAGSGFDLSGSAGDILARLAAERSAAARMAMDDGRSARENAYLQALEFNKAGRRELVGSVIEAAGAIAGGASGIQSQRRAEQRHRDTMERNRVPAPAPKRPGTASSGTTRVIVKPRTAPLPGRGELTPTLPPMTSRVIGPL